MTQNSAPDTISLDVPAARALRDALAGAAVALAGDEAVLAPLLEEASRQLGRDQNQALQPLRGARLALGDLFDDLGRRLALIEATGRDVARINELSARLDAFTGHPNDPLPQELAEERRAIVLALVHGDEEMAARVDRLIRARRSVPEALREAGAEVARELRAGAVAAELGIGQLEARQLVHRVDRSLTTLADRGMPEREAMAAVALVEQFGLRLADVLDRMIDTGAPILDTIGEVLTARGLGLELAAVDALGGLEAFFGIFDNATGGDPDGLVSRVDLEFVVAHPRRFTTGQVAAAEAMLAQPVLMHRLDSAHENEEILVAGRGADGFGRTDPADGLVSAGDLRAFMLKANLHVLLGPHADGIDIAADPTGRIDGVVTRSDFESYLADNPDLPEAVVAAAGVMIEAGYFDESWWQEHKDELALGAALVAGGLVIVATAGSAGVLVVAGAGAAAAGGTTVAVNWATDEEVFDDVVANSVSGMFVATGVHAAAAGVVSYSLATTRLAQAAAAAEIAAGASGVVGSGGVDLLLPEEHERAIHDLADAVDAMAGVGDVVLPRTPTPTDDGVLGLPGEDESFEEPTVGADGVSG